MNASDLSLSQFDAIRKRALAVGLVAIVLCLAGMLFNRQQFFRSYLMAYLFWVGIPLGCFAIVMLHHLVGGAWGFVIQRLLESGIRTFPLMALLFLPVFLGMQDLYLWAQPEVLAADPILQQKSVYLNMPFFVARTVVYFAIWISIASLLNKWSLEQDRTAEGSLTRRLQSLSGPGLVVYGLTVTFSSIDWVMSLEPRWSSTIYGMMFMVSYALAALAFVITVAFLLAQRRPLSQVVGPGHFHDLGNLLLALVMFWAYLAFCQFLIVWVENLTEEIPWYLHRMTGGWQRIALSLILCQFALPFMLLLSQSTKRSAGMLSAVALMILVMHWIDMFWLVAPAFHPAKLYLHWMDVAAPIGIGGIWISAFFWQLKDRSLLPLHDPRFAQVLEQVQGAEI
jgi:hypothetical protein